MMEGQTLEPPQFPLLPPKGLEWTLAGYDLII